MILIDGLIFDLQKMGGISSMMIELLKSLKNENIKVLIYGDNFKNLGDLKKNQYLIKEKKLFERIRRIQIEEGCTLHSTYYRTLKEKDASFF